MRAFIFPGQGSQFPGMGRDLADAFPAAREVFEEIDHALGQHLTRIMWDDGDDRLNLTENTQPALMAVSMAVMRVLARESNIQLPQVCKFVAGHSLGEYSALTAAGSLDLAEAARLLRLRGQAMQAAVPVGQGGMAAILGLDFDEVAKIAADAAEGPDGKEVLAAANDNSPGQVVVSGTAAAVQRAIALATERGAKRALPLPVSAPFHCALMQPAAAAMEKALALAQIRPPSVPLVANITAAAITAPDDIRRLLVEQVTGTVRWRESVLWMKEQGITEMIEIGAGKVLAGLVKRIDKDIAAESVGTPTQIEALVAKLT